MPTGHPASTSAAGLGIHDLDAYGVREPAFVARLTHADGRKRRGAVGDLDVHRRALIASKTDGTFSLPLSEHARRCGRHPTSVARSRQRLVADGVWEVVQQGGVDA